MSMRYKALVAEAVKNGWIKKAADYKPVVRCGPSKTKQSFGAISDIRNILDKYRKTGVVDYVNKGSPAFQDVAGLGGDLHEIMNKVRAAQEAFADLSPIVRTRFKNDSVELLDFLADESNRPEAIKLGLIPAPKEPVVETPPASLGAAAAVPPVPAPQPPAPGGSGGSPPSAGSPPTS